MPRWGMVIDLRKCIGCYSCMIACKEEHFLPPGIFWNRLLIGENGKANPFANTWIGIDTQSPVEREKELQDVRKHDNETKDRARQEQQQAKRQKDMDVFFLVRIESGRHEEPNLIKNPRARQNEPRN